MPVTSCPSIVDRAKENLLQDYQMLAVSTFESHICDYLQKMDQSENTQLNEEEQKIQELAKATFSQCLTSLGIGAFPGIAFGTGLAGILATALAPPIAILGGLAIGGGVTSFFGAAILNSLRLENLKKHILIINDNRFARLNEKVRVISNEILKLEKNTEKNAASIDQLDRARTFFSSNITSYKLRVTVKVM